MTLPSSSPYGSSWSPPPRADYTWEAPTDGELRSFAVPSTWGPGARAGTARVTNNTRGTLRVMIGAGRSLDTDAQVVAPYSTATIALDADGITARWSGVVGTVGGDEQVVTVELVATSSAVSAAAMSEPTFPYQERISWRPGPDGDTAWLYDFRNIGGGGFGLIVSPTNPGSANGGQPIVALAVQNRTTYTIAIRASSSGQTYGVIEPLTESTVLVGLDLIFLETVKTATIPQEVGAGGATVTLTAMDTVPRLDPSASSPLQGFNAPGNMTDQVNAQGQYGASDGWTATVVSIPEGRSFVVNYAAIRGYTTLNTSPAIASWQPMMELVNGADGRTTPPAPPGDYFMRDTAIMDAAFSAVSNLFRLSTEFHGPMLVEAPDGYGANAIRVRTRTDASVRVCVVHWILQGWFLAEN